MVKIIILFIMISNVGCANHQDLLAPLETGNMKPVNTQWIKNNEIDDSKI